MSQLSAGKEILSFCNKCKLTLAHTIVVMKNDKIPGKVTCNTCKSAHAYKDPAAAAAASKTAAKKREKKRDGRPQIPLAEFWQQSVTKARGPGRAYSPKTVFVVGDLLEHATFGTGVVDKIFDKTKMEVIFQDNIRTLMHSL
ncbi:MAG: hypothetical protein A2X86_14235 [Bdellovibrionales bacterium GWA2_49_15]|nr:MAG: hypothetical protein A2X86_14235 [Bdellovibrionales bacterium GWA2_49_15]HAZ14078.1 hypothetical protein [Bdellovibrionales bacterium]